MRITTLAFLMAGILITTGCGKKKKEEQAKEKQQAGAKGQAMRVDGYIVKTAPFQENIEVPVLSLNSRRQDQCDSQREWKR